MIALHFWIDPEPDPFDPTRWKEGDTTCRIYDSDGERFAIVDQKYFAQLVTAPNPKPPGRKVSNYRRYGKISPRLWNIKPLHPNRNGKKLYFVSNAGWRKGEGVFLHVEVMRLSGRKPPTPKHKIVNHIDGDEWNCTEDNLEWATHVKNRRMSKQKYIAASEMKQNER